MYKPNYNNYGVAISTVDFTRHPSKNYIIISSGLIISKIINSF